MQLSTLTKKLCILITHSLTAEFLQLDLNSFAMLTLYLGYILLVLKNWFLYFL